MKTNDRALYQNEELFIYSSSGIFRVCSLFMFTRCCLKIHRKVSQVGMATGKRASKRTQIAYEPDGPVDSHTSAEKKKKVFEPASWREVYKNIEQMRSEQVAPVDTMGCEKCHDGKDF